MKARITALTLTIFISACAMDSVPVTTADGKQGYTINCNSGVDLCHKKSAKLCPAGYDIVEHIKESSTVIPHYGEYPMTLNTESLIIECK